MKIIKHGDFVEVHDNGIKHTFRRRDISRVSINEKGTISMHVPGHCFTFRLMEVEFPAAKTSEALYSKVSSLMKDRAFTWI